MGTVGLARISEFLQKGIWSVEPRGLGEEEVEAEEARESKVTCPK